MIPPTPSATCCSAFFDPFYDLGCYAYETVLFLAQKIMHIATALFTAIAEFTTKNSLSAEPAPIPPPLVNCTPIDAAPAIVPATPPPVPGAATPAEAAAPPVPAPEASLAVTIPPPSPTTQSRELSRGSNPAFEACSSTRSRPAEPMQEDKDYLAARYRHYFRIEGTTRLPFTSYGPHTKFFARLAISDLLFHPSLPSGRLRFIRAAHEAGDTDLAVQLAALQNDFNGFEPEQRTEMMQRFISTPDMGPGVSTGRMHQFLERAHLLAERFVRTADFAAAANAAKNMFSAVRAHFPVGD